MSFVVPDFDASGTISSQTGNSETGRSASRAGIRTMSRPRLLLFPLRAPQSPCPYPVYCSTGGKQSNRTEYNGNNK